jgi:hypothetical protein
MPAQGRDFLRLYRSARLHELVCQNQQSLNNRGQANEHDQQFKKICQPPVRSKFVPLVMRLGEHPEAALRGHALFAVQSIL